MVLGNEELASSLGLKPAQSGICSASSSMLAQHFATRSHNHPVAEIKRQKRGGEEAQNARSGEEERGNRAEMDSEEGEKIMSHEQLQRCSSSFCFPAQGCAGAPLAPGQHEVSLQLGAGTSGWEGQCQSSHITRTWRCQGNSSLGTGSIILGLLFFSSLVLHPHSIS